MLDPASQEKAGLACPLADTVEHGDGAQIYEKFVKPAIVDISRLAAHYAIRSVFEDPGETSRIYSYSAQHSEFARSEAGKMKLVTGMAQFTSLITRESAGFAFGVLHLGDHNVSGGVRRLSDHDEYGRISQQLHAAFARALWMSGRHAESLTEADLAELGLRLVIASGCAGR